MIGANSGNSNRKKVPVPFAACCFTRHAPLSPIKITVAVVVVLAAALLYRGGYSWGEPVLNALQYVTTAEPEWSSLIERTVPAFRNALGDWELPVIAPAEEPEEKRCCRCRAGWSAVMVCGVPRPAAVKRCITGLTLPPRRHRRASPDWRRGPGVRFRRGGRYSAARSRGQVADSLPRINCGPGQSGRCSFRRPDPGQPGRTLPLGSAPPAF